PERHLVDYKAPEPDFGRYYVSVDYGTHNPCSMGLWRVENGVAVRVREFYHEGKKTGQLLTDEEYYEALCRLVGDVPLQYVLVDPSAASFIACIRRHGRFSVKRAKNAVADGIRVTAGLLSAGRLYFDKSCRGIIREFGAYVWDREASEDRVVKDNDHAMDEMRYFCYTVLRGLEEKNEHW
ncbi:MAG: PBSX family phage terminase large subunit, partial [Clostridia bacterium]|nr:PBSX family phage terminase large subunit [Clostridia bacterium]